MSNVQPSMLLGVDGGNTKTVAIVASADGTVIGSGRAGRSDIYNAPDEEAALDEISQAVTEALAEASATPADLAASVFSMAGADWPEDVDFLTRGLIRRGLGRRIRVVNDAIGALRAGTPDGIGVSITCGTGIAIGARNVDGREWYSGHWAVAFGGAELGERALHAVYEAHLGLGPATSLTEGLLVFFEAAHVEEVLHRCTARGTDRHWMQQARLAPILLDAATSGDKVACAIVHEAGERNANVALIAARAVGLARPPVRFVLSGGVIRHSSGLLKHVIQRRIETEIPGVEVVHNPPEPVVGAVLLAADCLGPTPDEKLRERLVSTVPGPWLFAT